MTTFPSDFWRRILAGLTLLSLCGCALVRTDTKPLAQIQAEHIGLADDIKLARDGWPEAAWWHRYRDSQLNSLIARALQEAPSLIVARERVKASAAQAKLVEAGSGALVGMKATIDRESISEEGFLGAYGRTIPFLGTNGPWYTQATVGLAATYEFDLWGKDHAKTRAALGVVNARKAEASQVELLLAAGITHVYFDIQLLHEKEALLREVRAIRSCSVDIHKARVERGLEAVTPLQLAHERLLEVDNQLVVVANQRRSLREALRALVGAGAGDLPEIAPMTLQEQPSALPPRLEFELLVHRPDLQAMSWYVQASLDQVSAARAAFYPNFDLRAFAGFDTLHTNELWHRSSRQLNLIPGVSLPLFDSGRLNANLATARGQSNTLVAQYNEMVFQAIKEVAQRSIEIEGLQRRVKLHERQMQAAKTVARSAEACRARGLADLATAREASLPWLQERLVGLGLRGANLHSEVALLTALGGGFDATQETK